MARNKNETPEVEAPEAKEEVALIDSAIGQAFIKAMDEGKSEDMVKMDMIQAGSKFKTVTREYNQLMVDTGRSASPERKSELVMSAVADNNMSTEEGFDAAVKYITGAESSISEKQAAASIRAYCRKNDIEVYKKPKGTGSGKSGFASEFYAYLAAEPRTEEEARAYIQGTDGNKETSDNVKRHESHYLGIWKLTADIREAA